MNFDIWSFNILSFDSAQDGSDGELVEPLEIRY